MEKLALEIFDRDGGGSKFANLPSDTSITITDTSELFDSGDIWTYSFKLNIYDNAHIFGSAGDMHGSRLHEQVDKRRARLWVLGLPLFYGYIRLDYEVDVETTGDIDISFESGQKTFLDMIEGAKANQVPLKDDVMIGMALIRERSVKRTGAKISVTGPRISPDPTVIGDLVLEGTAEFAQIFPKYVRPDGTFQSRGGNSETISGTINTDSPYDSAHPYCNTRLCYQQYAFKTNNGELEKTAVRGYKICEPRRINPSPNFYVLYWIDCLMKHLGIHIEENGMLDVEDLKRLFFVNTKCAYDVKDNGFDGYYSGDYVHFGYQSPFVPLSTDDEPSNKIECQVDLSRKPTVKLMHVGDNVINRRADGRQTNWWQKAYASSENFPDADIKDVIEAIGNAFGARFLFNDDYTKVRIVLLRDVLRSQEVHELPCDVTEVTKQESSIRGFRLTYGAGEEDTNYFYRGFASKLAHKAEQWPDTSDTHDYSQWDLTKHYGDITDEVGMLNKTCYIDMTTGNSYIVKIDENWKKASDEAFPSLFECAAFMDAEDGDCTGESDTIKELRIGFTPIVVNAQDNGTKDYNDQEGLTDANPHLYAIFVNQEMSVPYAITSGGRGSGNAPSSSTLIDKSPASVWNETVDSLTWAPQDNEEHATVTKKEAKWQSGLMEIATATPVVVKKSNGSDTFSINFGRTTRQVKFSGWIREGYRIYLDDNYEINDEMECPLEKQEWGLTLGIMRGSGSDSSTHYEEDTIENEGNDMWDIAPGTGAYTHSDTCDDYGDVFDYTPDGQDDPQDMTGRFSLKLRAEKPNPYYVPGVPDVVRTKEEAGVAMTKLYTTSDADLLNRPLVPNATMRAAGWDAPGDGYATVYSIGIGVLLADGIVHEILWSPIKPDGTVKTSAQLQTYVDSFTGLALGQIKSHDTDHLILDINTTEDRAEILHELQAVYYAEAGEEVEPVNVSIINSKYLDITTPALRKRGLMDQFHQEESYWWRNGKTAKQKVQMELAQYLSIDKTVRQKIGDITGFVKKMQFSVHIQTGMSDVTVEMLYL